MQIAVAQMAERHVAYAREGGVVAPDAAAEAALIQFCRQSGLFRRYSSGVLAGHTVSAEWLGELLAEARRHGVRHVLLEVAADNGPAQKLYSEYGFDVVGVRRGYYQASGADALVMRRDEP